MNRTPIPCLTMALTDDEARAMAQFLKRVAIDDYRRLAVDDEEAEAMRAAGEAIRQALAEQGYAPR